VGSTLRDRFEIRRQLGAGTYGEVFAAYDKERQETVALKTLNQSDPASLYRFKQEFRAHADLRHPNLVRLYELLGENDRWFFTMELVEGRELVAWARGLPAGEPRHASLRQVLRQIAEGVRALHLAGKLHRDLKPSNVLVTPEGRVVILDFGLFADLSAAQIYESLDADVVGTPAYMAPEQGAGLPPSEASDWYSVGALLFEVLTGAPPFQGTFVQVMLTKQREDAPSPTTLNPHVPEDLATLCDDLLRRDPAARPDGDDVLHRLGASPRPESDRSGSYSETTPLFGRAAELDALRGAWREAREGRLRLALVHGASGLGKTALVQTFLRECREAEPDTVVLVGRCYRNESVPYKAVDSLMDLVSRYLRRLPYDEAVSLLPPEVLALARLFPVLRRVEAVGSARRHVLDIPDSQEQRRLGFHALRSLLSRLAARHPLVVFVDDLQWGDTDSAILFHELFRPPSPPPMLWVGAYRDPNGEPSPFLEEFLRSDRSSAAPGKALDLALAGLEPTAAAELASYLLGEELASSTLAASIGEETRGNPFHIDELVRHAREDRQGARVAKSRRSVDDAVRWRVARLDAEARALLEVVAVAGQPIALSVAHRAAGIASSPREALARLRWNDLARAAHGHAGDRVETFHDRVREAVVAGLEPERLAAHHRRLGVELESSGRADPETLAVHFAAAGEVARASAYAEQAADRAAEALAFDRAARLYRKALELAEPRGAARRSLLVRLGAALVDAGRGAEAARAFLEASEGASAAQALEMRRRAAEQLLISGHIDEGLDALQTILGTVGLKIPTTPRKAVLGLIGRRLQLRLRGLEFRPRDSSQISDEELTRIDTCWSAAIGLGIVDTMRGAYFQAQHLLRALAAGEPYRVARALAVEVGYSATGGERTRDRTADLVRRTFEVVARSDNPHALGLATMTAGLAAYLEGRWARAREQLEEAERILRGQCKGVAWELDNANFYGLRSLLFLGEVGELSSRLHRRLKEAEERGDLYAMTNMRTRVAWLVALARDAPDEARRGLADAIAQWSREGFHLQHFWDLMGRTEIALYEGRAGEARELLAEAWPRLEGSLLMRIQGTLIEAHHLRGRIALAAAASPERVDGLDEATTAARAIEKEGTSWGAPLAGALRAEIARRRRDPAALDRFTAAEGGFRAADMALHAAACRFRRGELQGGDEGLALQDSALAWMRSQGIAEPDRFLAMMVPGP
jgi:tetratricopeptide (TPR) repeat protein/predicted Ser/Thr protein kinase